MKPRRRGVRAGPKVARGPLGRGKGTLAPDHRPAAAREWRRSAEGVGSVGQQAERQHEPPEESDDHDRSPEPSRRAPGGISPAERGDPGADEGVRRPPPVGGRRGSTAAGDQGTDGDGDPVTCTRCEDCITLHIHATLRAGATVEQVHEAIGVAVMMGGGPASTCTTHAIDALEQFHDVRADARIGDVRPRSRCQRGPSDEHARARALDTDPVAGLSAPEAARSVSTPHGPNELVESPPAPWRRVRPPVHRSARDPAPRRDRDLADRLVERRRRRRHRSKRS